MDVFDFESKRGNLKQESEDRKYDVVYQLVCAACLSTDRALRILNGEALQRYNVIVGDIPINRTNMSPRLCWECLAILKTSICFEQRAKESFQLLLTSLPILDKQDISSLLLSVSRPPRLQWTAAANVDIQPDTHIDTAGIHTQREGFKQEFDGPDEITTQHAEKTNSSLKRDTKTHTKETSYQCRECPRAFVQKGNLKTHSIKRREASIKKEMTKYETHGSSTSPIYEVMITDVKHNNIGYETPIKNEKQTKLRKLTAVKTYQCRKCLIAFTSKTNLTNHRREHKDILQRYQCNECLKSFGTKPNLIRHIAVHSDDRPYKCSLCKKAFKVGSHLSNHMRVHKGVRPHMCQHCKKAFGSKHNLNRHLQRIHTGETQSYQCTECLKVFDRKPDLIKHIRVIHTDEKPYKCSLCDKAFKVGSNLSTHISLHTGGRPYMCQYCAKTFVRKHTLNVHLRSHLSKDPAEFTHQCNMCPKKFELKAVLKKHMMIHKGEKPHLCNFCPKAFTQKTHLIFHMRGHTGDRPFKCTYSNCPKRYPSKGDLNRHIRKHNKYPFQCNYCSDKFSRKQDLVSHIDVHNKQ